MNDYNIETKGKIVCSRCNEELPANVNYFYRNKRSKTGLDPRCKVCWGQKYGIRHPNKVLSAKDGYKFCAICHKERQYRNFSFTKGNKDGYASTCKDCASVIGKEYDSRPEVKKRAREYGRKWRKEYYKTDAGIAMNRKHINLRRSRIESVPYSYSDDDWLATLDEFGDSCAYCGGKEADLHQEHVIPLSKGGYYTKQNIIPACQFCNSSKHARDLEDWYPEQPYYSKKRHKFINEWINKDKQNNQQLTLI